MLEFLRKVVLSNAAVAIREDALERLIVELRASKKIGNVPVSAVCYEAVVSFLEMKKKIHAIKMLRAETKLGLLESKLAIEQFMAERGFPYP